MALNLFNGGYLPLEQRCLAENALLGHLQQAAASSCSRWTTCRKICRASTTLLADTYFCNFSLFQSMPD